MDTVVELADGRSPGVLDWGRRDPPPVIFDHGLAGNRFEAELVSPIVERGGLAVRLIAFDRPGDHFSWARSPEVADVLTAMIE